MADPPGATRLDELAAEGDAGWALDALLWGGDMAASLQTLERSRGRLAEALGLDMSPAAIAAATAAATASTGAEESKGSAAGASPASSEEMAQPMDTGETPLVSSAWLNWDNPRAATKLSAGLPEDTQELRRLKTRDAMRRSRQRQRDQLQQLRDAVAGLEKQYSSMCLVTDTEVTAAGRGAELEDAVALSKRLGAENLLLKASIQKQEAWRQQLSVVMESRVYLAEQAADRERAKASASGTSVAPSLPFSPEFLDPIEAKSVFGFRPLSDEDVKDLILSNSRVVKNVQKQLLTGRRGSGDDAELVQPVAKLDVFGWDVRQRVRGSLMEFVFTKRFTGVSISEIMHKTWVNEMQLKGMQKVKYDTKRLDILQEVNPNAYVIGREVLSPDATPPFRTTMVRYRMEHHAEPVTPPPGSSDDDADADALVPNLVASGYAIGICSINPDPEAREPVTGPLPTASSYAKELAVGVLWADLSYMIEFLSVADAATGQEQYVEVRWSGRTDYKSQFHAYRNTADKISTLLHWELLNIAPPVTHIISTSPRGER